MQDGMKLSHVFFTMRWSGSSSRAVRKRKAGGLQNKLCFGADDTLQTERWQPWRGQSDRSLVSFFLLLLILLRSCTLSDLYDGVKTTLREEYGSWGGEISLVSPLSHSLCRAVLKWSGYKRAETINIQHCPWRPDNSWWEMTFDLGDALLNTYCL